jgi:biotin-(acetyl-CoA carboxylase) ligase
MHRDEPQFPPLLKGHGVHASLAPFAEACRAAQARELGAADIVWSRASASAALAIVLEPEVALECALQMAPLLMVALGDCLGALCPPQVGVQYRWPMGILLNGSPAGEVRIGAPRVPLKEVPGWLVVGAELAVMAPRDGRQDWSNTSLEEEAGAGINRSDILASLASHFLSWVNTWQEVGFRPICAAWLSRAEGRQKPVVVASAGGPIEGEVVGLDENGNLLLKTTKGEVEHAAFIDHVELMEPAR